MFLNALFFLLGILLLQNFIVLPKIQISYILILLVVILKIISKKYWCYVKFPALCILGFSWCLIYVYWQTSWTLPENLEGKTVKITGKIVSVPETDSFRTTFLFALKNVNQLPAKGLVHLSWQNPKSILTAGDEWMLGVHMKKIHSTMNPGGFDYEAFSLQEGVRATGYIYKDDTVLLSHHYSLAHLRQYLHDRINAAITTTNTSPWITALALGIRQNISQENWDVLRNTGTNHLMAIGGLHIGFMSAFIYALMNWCWRRIPRLCLILPAQHAASVAALIAAISYSALAGFSLPTQRACLMLSIFLVIHLLKRHILSWHSWSLALIIVLVINPLSVLTQSFWLSFTAVGLIIYGMNNRLAPKGLWWKYGRIQWILMLGLIPLCLWFFQECSLMSFIANSIAIPWVGLIIVPLTLLGLSTTLISIKVGGCILSLADKCLALLWIILTYLSHLKWSTWTQFIPDLGLLIAMMLGVILLLLPKGFPGRWFGIICIIPGLLYHPLTPTIGEIWMTMLDVGQGLSTVIQTQNHILIYDTGARLNDDYDMGKSVVLPFLQTLGTKKIDMLVISHGDNDHSGGAQGILKKLPVDSIKTSVPELFVNANYCLQNQSWQWDGVNFQFLYPDENHLGLDNDSSCVLKISNATHQILLTGDIEKKAEKFLLQTSTSELKSEILIAPHHGSKTSGLNDFINAVKPKVVLFPVGYRNRYHLPNVSVVQKYQDLQAKLYDSVSGGAIQIKLTGDQVVTAYLYRKEALKYWNIV